MKTNFLKSNKIISSTHLIPDAKYRGFTIGLALIITSSVLLITISITSILIRDIKNSASDEKSSIAYNLAESALECAVSYENNIREFDSSGNNITGVFPTSYSTTPVTTPPVSGILGTTGSNPQGITIDSAGNIYTANYNSHNLTKITPAGVSTILVTAVYYPLGITIDSAGNIYITKQYSDTVTKITSTGVSTVLGTTGSSPLDMAIDSAGNMYVTNRSSNTVTKITPAGISTTFGTTGSFPLFMTIDSAGNIYTTNHFSNNVTKITPSGVSSILGTTGSGPYDITLDSAGNIYTANSGSNNVTKITPSGVSSILGTTGSNPQGITIDSAGNIYTANSGSNNVTKITPSGVSSILGTTGSRPSRITIDSAGNIYTANLDSNNVTKITIPLVVTPPDKDYYYKDYVLGDPNNKSFKAKDIKCFGNKILETINPATTPPNDEVHTTLRAANPNDPTGYTVGAVTNIKIKKDVNYNALGNIISGKNLFSDYSQKACIDINVYSALEGATYKKMISSEASVPCNAKNATKRVLVRYLQ
jgi:streptogramin lyase